MVLCVGGPACLSLTFLPVKQPVLSIWLIAPRHPTTVKVNRIPPMRRAQVENVEKVSASKSEEEGGRVGEGRLFWGREGVRTEQARKSVGGGYERSHEHVAGNNRSALFR